ncbi:hypothetical protein BD408DRAFT_422475 [Parasitella parasitica]|nr:hypothetical protein BD408DRAFT_422475 [Parasitella parasitica]
MLLLKKLVKNTTVTDRKGLFAKCRRKLTSILVANQHKPTNIEKETTNKQRKHTDAGMTIQPIDITPDDWRLSILAELNLLPHGEDKDLSADQQHTFIMNTCQPMERKEDLIKLRLDIAAARRNRIKEIRLREQLDTALFETMQLLRQQEFEKREKLSI